MIWQKHLVSSSLFPRLATKEFPSEKTHFFFPILPLFAIEMARGGSLKTEGREEGLRWRHKRPNHFLFASHPLHLSSHHRRRRRKTAGCNGGTIETRTEALLSSLEPADADAGARTSSIASDRPSLHNNGIIGCKSETPD